MERQVVKQESCMFGNACITVTEREARLARTQRFLGREGKLLSEGTL